MSYFFSLPRYCTCHCTVWLVSTSQCLVLPRLTRASSTATTPLRRLMSLKRWKYALRRNGPFRELTFWFTSLLRRRGKRTASRAAFNWPVCYRITGKIGNVFGWALKRLTPHDTPTAIGKLRRAACKTLRYVYIQAEAILKLSERPTKHDRCGTQRFYVKCTSMRLLAQHIRTSPSRISNRTLA